MVPVYVLLVLILSAIVYFIFLLKRQNNSNDLAAKLNQIFPQLLKNASEQLITLADQKIGTDLANKKDSIEKMVKQVLDQLSTVEKERIGSFNGLREAIENSRRITQQLAVTTEALKKTLSSDRMRGAFGEKVAEDLLKQSGFVIGTDYTKQETGGNGRPDFTIYLPDKTKINVDSKFPYANIVRMSETDDPDQKNQYLKAFERNLKDKITEVTTRDYINPSENTVDFVVVFIPNEMIFSFIYERFPDLLEEAFAKKVVFAGPFSFTAILRMVRQAYDNFRFQKNVQSIITQIKIFSSEFEKYNQEFSKIGDRIDSLHKQYNEVDHARTNKLQKVIDKISLEHSSPPSLDAQVVD